MEGTARSGVLLAGHLAAVLTQYRRCWLGAGCLGDWFVLVCPLFSELQMHCDRLSRQLFSRGKYIVYIVYMIINFFPRL